jgi:hypothetical protein
MMWVEESNRRINEFSEPLAQAGISIFYMSTYQTDLIMVKERNLMRVIAELQLHGFEFSQENLQGLAPHHQTAPRETKEMPVDLDTVRKYCNTSIPQDELAMVGLSKEYRAYSVQAVIRALLYPELLPAGSESRFVSYTATEDGMSLLANTQVFTAFDAQWLHQRSNAASLRAVQISLLSFGLGTLICTVTCASR